MHQSLDDLLKSADLNIIEFDVHNRKEMKTFNRVLPFYVMSYHKKGEAKLQMEGKTYTISPGTVLLIPPLLKHGHFKTTDEESVFLWFHFTYSIANVIDVLALFEFPYMFKLQNSDRFEKVFYEYLSLNSNEDFLSTSILRKAKAYELLFILLEEAVSKKDPNMSVQNEGFLNIMFQIIHFPENEISLKRLGDTLHLHPTYICNRFKELFGKSPIQVQKEVRIDKAKVLLRSSELTISEISQALGFTSNPSFTRLFKNYVGISPTQFRNLNRKWAE